MITKDDVLITSAIPSYYNIHCRGEDFTVKMFISMDIYFILFGSIICEATIHKDLKTEDEIHNEIVNYINLKITK